MNISENLPFVAARPALMPLSPLVPTRRGSRHPGHIGGRPANDVWADALVYCGASRKWRKQIAEAEQRGESTKELLAKWDADEGQRDVDYDDICERIDALELTSADAVAVRIMWLGRHDFHVGATLADCGDEWKIVQIALAGLLPNCTGVVRTTVIDFLSDPDRRCEETLLWA